MKPIDETKPLIVGHRGVAGSYPENTKASIQAAISQGLAWVEVDIQPTKDGHLVVCHDHTIDRCSNGHGRVDQHTLQELQQLDFGAWFDSVLQGQSPLQGQALLSSPLQGQALLSSFVGESILTLDELLLLAEEHQLGLNLEIKLEPTLTDVNIVESVTKTLADKLSEFKPGKDQILLSSFCPCVVRALARFCPDYKLGVISEKLCEQDIELLREVDAFSCHLNYRSVSEGDIAQLRNMKHQIWCYTVNQPGDFTLINQVDAIFSDFPERF